MITIVNIVDAPHSGGAGDNHSFGVGEWVRVPQHQRPRQIVTVRTDMSEPYYAFNDGFGRKWWSETVLLTLNPVMPEIASQSADTALLASDKAYVPQIAVRANFTLQPAIPDALVAHDCNWCDVVQGYYPVIEPSHWLAWVDTEPDTAALDGAAITVTETLTYLPEDADEVFNRYAHVAALMIPADLLPMNSIRVDGSALEAGDVIDYGAPRKLTRVEGGYLFYEYERNGETVEHAAQIHASAGLYSVCGGPKFDAAKADRSLCKRNAAGQWVWISEKVLA